MSPEQWFYVHTETQQRTGPVSSAQIAELIRSGKLRDTDYVWKQGMANWAPLSEMKNQFVQQQPRASASAFPTADSDLNMDLGGLNLGGGLDMDAAGTGGIQVDFDLGESVAERHPYPKGGRGGGSGGGGLGGGGGGDSAGFWLRSGAFMLDFALLLIVYVGASFAFLGEPAPGFWKGYENAQRTMGPMSSGLPTTGLDQQPFLPSPEELAFGLVFALLVPILYGALMEWSPLQGTLGKLAVRIQVADKNGGGASILRCFLRNFVKWVPWSIPCVCCFSPLLYLVVAFTPEKQGIHDLLSGCLVERK